jgi:hypothetical protein
MVDQDDHEACVEAWMKEAAKGLPPEQMIQAFEQGFGALWQRAHKTLGDVTLTAIVDRVLYDAAENYPVLAPLKLEITGIQWQRLGENVRGLDRDQVAEGLRFVLVEFLTVLGNLTANILSPSLHAELSKIVPEESVPDAKNSPGQRRHPARKSEKPKS